MDDVPLGRVWRHVRDVAGAGRRATATAPTVNTATGAWSAMSAGTRRKLHSDARRYVFRNAERHRDAGRPHRLRRRASYTAVLVGGWEMFQSPSQTCVWHQARASFVAAPNSPFRPQLSACTDYVVKIPQPPVPGPDPGVNDVWDEGLWDEGRCGIRTRRQRLWFRTPGGSPSGQRDFRTHRSCKSWLDNGPRRTSSWFRLPRRSRSWASTWWSR